jgi:hypothetical protein
MSAARGPIAPYGAKCQVRRTRGDATSNAGKPARCCANVGHYFAKLIATATIGLAQFGMEDT